MEPNHWQKISAQWRPHQQVPWWGSAHFHHWYLTLKSHWLSPLHLLSNQGCSAIHPQNTMIRFMDGTTALGLISCPTMMRPMTKKIPKVSQNSKFAVFPLSTLSVLERSIMTSNPFYKVILHTLYKRPTIGSTYSESQSGPQAVLLRNYLLKFCLNRQWFKILENVL